jgi:hypothetical protein
MLVVFSLSGLLHAGGSYLQPANTSPLRTLTGFQLQFFGILIQIFLTERLGRIGGDNYQSLKKLLILCFGVGWACYTAPLALDDIAAGQLFRLRPLPVSIAELVLGKR